MAERTFRDPAGWLELRPDGAYRFLRPAYEAELLEFLSSPLATQLVDGGRLISSEVVEPGGGKAQEPMVLRHPLVPFASYPWEWSPALWLSAAELTLTLCRDLVAQGWILKDATPLNILFRGTDPVLVDVLSVARLDATVPIWYAYGQFVRCFLLPMLAHTLLGWPLRATLLRRDGYEPEELYVHLPVRERLRQPARSAITLPLLLGNLGRRGRAATKENQVAGKRDPEFVQHVLKQTCTRLLRQMRRAMPQRRASTWSAYSGTATHYSQADHAAKRAFVADALQRARPAHVLDVGCNAGIYSDLAADAGASVVAIDTDAQTVDQLCDRLKGTGRRILPLVADLANPTPAAGWQNRESASFLQRACGFFDGVIMLAVIHHLLLHDHIPLPEVARLCASLTTGTLVIEWVPPTDVMFRELVRGRDAIFANITEQAFRHSFAASFTITREKALDNGRILFHMERHQG